jgi:hypothetical protein
MLDGAMWCAQNDAMVAWQQRLRLTGVKTAILSNMGDAVNCAIERECSWVHSVDAHIWSHEFGCTKPDERIYQHTLDRLGVEPGQALFLDDREENVLAARRCRMHSLAFSAVSQLRSRTGFTPSGTLCSHWAPMFPSFVFVPQFLPMQRQPFRQLRKRPSRQLDWEENPRPRQGAFAAGFR